MPNLATWIREKDKKWFEPFFDRHPQLTVWNACQTAVEMDQMDGLLLTGGADIAPEFLRQDVPDVSVLENEMDPIRDAWEFAAIATALERALPLFAICKGMQALNVALGGTLKLDIGGHNLPEQKNEDIQPLRTDRNAAHQFSNVNSAHHQAVDRLADGWLVEAWCAEDDIVEQIRLRDYPFALGVQYHPERGTIYDALFDDFFSRIKNEKRSRED